jgi:hypothetical protein
MTETDKKVITDIIHEFGIDITYFVFIGLLHPDDARNWLIRKLYEKRRILYQRGETNENIETIKEDLSVKYGVSFSKVEKLIYNR